MGQRKEVNALFTSISLLVGGVALLLFNDLLANLGFGGYLIFAGGHILWHRRKRILKDIQAESGETLLAGLSKRNLSAPLKIILLLVPVVMISLFPSQFVVAEISWCVDTRAFEVFDDFCFERATKGGNVALFNATRYDLCMKTPSNPWKQCMMAQLKERRMLCLSVLLALSMIGCLAWYKFNKCRRCIIDAISCGVYPCSQHGPHSEAAAAAEASSISTISVLRRLFIKGLKDICTSMRKFLFLCAVSFAYGGMMIMLIHHIAPAALTVRPHL